VKIFSTKDILRIGLLFFGTAFCLVGNLRAQTADSVDLGIRIINAPSEVKINGVFGLTAEVYIEANSSSLPNGESVEAIIRLLDPDGIIIDSHIQSFNGFNASSNGNLSNSSHGNLLFQIPWSQSLKWDANATWTITLNLSGSSTESSMENNAVSHSLSVQMPNLQISIDGVSAIDPITGTETLEFVPNTNYTVRGTITNTGVVMTQPNVLFAVEAVSPDASVNFEISNLFLPADATGDYIIRVTVNPQNITSGPVLQEESFLDNNDISNTINISTAANQDPGTGALLTYVENSYVGERGNFRGLEPIFISFAVRNAGRSPVTTSDIISARVYLSKDQSTDESDFILREFNLGGGGIGEGLLAGETINLTWFQQLPDNFIGDFYLLIEISNQGQSRAFPMDSTPMITLNADNSGITSLVQTQVNNGSFAERPSVSKSGRYVVYEKSVQTASGDQLQQIYLMDGQNPNGTPRLISKSFSNNNSGGNDSSFRPRISQDGSTVVFHSAASDLVPGDTNSKEDVFLYRVSTDTIFRAVNANNQQLNGRSLYPDINVDGSKVVFESDATNADLNNTAVSGQQIYLWTINESSGSSIKAITNGNNPSYAPSIDDAGNRIVFDSFASNLLDQNTSGLENAFDNGGNINFGSDTNELSDIYLVDLNQSKIYLASVNFNKEQAESGSSYNARISGNGERIAFESKAQ